MAAVEAECFEPRIQRVAAGSNPTFDYYLNTGRDFSAVDLTEALEEWTRTRQRIIVYVNDLSSETLLQTGVHQTFGEINILGALQIMLDNDREHIEELMELVNLHEKS